jgi:hypothetical protein
MAGGSFGKSQYVEARTELLDDLEVFVRSCRFFRTVNQFCKRDDRYTELIRKAVEPRAGADDF